MRFLTIGARLLLGLTFFVFGLNYFLEFLPKPDNMDPEMGAFLGAIVAGKLLAVAKIVEIAAGLALLTNRFVPLALALLAPVLVGILVVHGVYDVAGIGLPVFLVALELWLAWSYRDTFAPMLRAVVVPHGHGANAGGAAARAGRMRDAEAGVHAR